MSTFSECKVARLRGVHDSQAPTKSGLDGLHISSYMIGDALNVASREPRSETIPDIGIS